MLDELRNQYADIKDRNRASFGAFLILHLSELLRSTYPEAEKGGECLAVTIRCLNEMIQVASKQVLRLLGHSEIGYPDDVFIATLLDIAEPRKCEEGLEWAMARALEDMRATGRETTT